MNTETDQSLNRLLALDAFRGITVAGMILVNNPGDWNSVYAPLEHAAWHGWTPTDLVFPFFLFIVGVAIALALGRRVSSAANKTAIHLKILRRAAIIFTLGLVQAAFPFFDLAHLRYPGVLQRIAVCYLVAALVFLHTNWKQQTLIAAGCLIFYWIVMTFLSVPGGAAGVLTPEGNFSGYVDRLLIGVNHMYSASKFYDPEGILSTIPAVATCLIGVLTGNWLKSQKTDLEKVVALFFCGACLTAIGWISDFWFPINKNLWTSSYVVFTAGLALCFLAGCYWLIDIKNYRRWAQPFVVFGSNALALYFFSSIFARIINTVKINGADGAAISVQQWIFQDVFTPLGAPRNASLLYSIVYIVFWFFLMWLLYRKKIFIKV